MHCDEARRRPRHRGSGRALPIGMALPNTDCAAVAPSATTSAAGSAQLARQPPAAGAISRAFGFLWSAHLPRGSNLKCLTALVT